MPRVSALLALVCACAALAAAQHDKRAEMSPVPFVLGSRYGRSPARHLMPRNDRFFMGSRYGKRSEYPVVPALGPAPRAPPPPHALLCEPAGVDTLYRCRPADTVDRKIDEDSSLSEDD